MSNSNKSYSDMINMPHHSSEVHPRMSISARAAQFAPFAALAGHDYAVKETARLTEKKKCLDESEKDILNMHIVYLIDHIKDKLNVQIKYFVHDKVKNGGEYTVVYGIISKYDECKNAIILDNGLNIQVDDILCIECDIFSRLE